ncbi:MAG: glutamate 5-kinase [Nitrososphaerales archaeon]|jgi:glutamate 5-kinase
MASRLVVVKAGTSSITTPDGKLDEEEMGKLADQIAEVMERKDRMILVTSGAIAAGVAELGIPRRPSHDIDFQQASAATGQSVLMAKYRELFKPHGIKVAQILLTAEDLSNRTSYLHTSNVLKRLLELGVLPIINENDVTSVDELLPTSEQYRVNFSDNDILSALVATAIRADILVILSDVDGLYTSDPREPEAVLMKTVENITPELKDSLTGKKSKTGRGGIQSKIRAAEIATKSGIPVVIANSRRENVIPDILSGIEVGTYFKPEGKMSAVKSWIAYSASVKGQIFINEGARKAILDGSSLLAVGITKVTGQFNAGDVVGIVDQNNEEFAKGNPNYTSNEINMIRGLQASEIKKKLGNAKEVIGRKKIHLLKETFGK